MDLRLTDEAMREGSALSGIPAVRYFSLPLSSAGNVRSDIVADGAEMDIVGHYVALLEEQCREYRDSGPYIRRPHERADHFPLRGG